MPISNDTWNKGKIESKDVKSEILNILEEDVGIAYTSTEILSYLQQFNDKSIREVVSGMGSLIRVQQILDELVGEDKIESKIVDEGASSDRYYRFKE
ncbi:Hypothetical protein Nlim_1725 [Candidatus Nitrosarchaeum limnium SFB1]|jgi:2-hydroxy-3-keto-5-methylthiopentenyl-1-phosphate phosphatase|uniref:Transcriptional regulator n=1 Tax=Candidatus Nitrosarchaeum limnium SFB1 TaxID=886738 RepID=F3KMH5_9ARCH|nr:Hypothetical protein Nlim_1725 [Candidatus Nitrosarchaeum limnium SFB1]